MLVPIDGSDRALALAPHVATVAKATKARITLAHCTRRGSAAEERGREHLYRARCAFEDLGLLPRTRIVRAPPAQGIVDYALPALDDDVPIDLIAMTTHGRTAWLDGHWEA